MDELCHRITEQVEIGLTETCDIDLFADHPIKDECPVCTNPLPLEERESTFTTCCGRSVPIHRAPYHHGGCGSKPQTGPVPIYRWAADRWARVWRDKKALNV